MKDSPRYSYKDSIKKFLITNNDEIFGKINHQIHGPVITTSKDAWDAEISIMKDTLKDLTLDEGDIIFEYDIPRLGKRIDVVLLIKGIIFVLEFKVNEKRKNEQDIDQVLDYALDLNNFHLFSRERLIVPILVPTKYHGVFGKVQSSAYEDRVINPIVVGETRLKEIISEVLSTFPNETPINPKWVISPYSPTPTIIEAAKELYVNHSVENITHHEADKASTDETIDYIISVINESEKKKQKSICFVTGVPGAGKTLVGLEVAIRKSYVNDKKVDEGKGAVYLSGNGPLVAVLTEALARDSVKRSKANGEKKTLTTARSEIVAFIQMIHNYRDNMLAKIKNPVENGTVEIDPTKAVKLDKAAYGEYEPVAIFDEAQRSWTKKRIADYLKRGGTYGNKIKIQNFPMSEAEFLIWSLDQRKDWATIVCLVGGGQEINTGEAGILEWIKALNNSFTNWNIYISPKLTDPEYDGDNIYKLLKNRKNVEYHKSLHLAVSLRSFRAEKLSAFVNKLLSFEEDTKALYKDISKNYPILLTRDVSKARKWLKDRERGNIRTGVLITKESARYKPMAIHVLPQGDKEVVHWFLDDKIDTRSSNYLEDAATEIQVQGLELDYACVLWDADMEYNNGKWKYYKFNGHTKWSEIIADSENKKEQQKYMLNAYRVLLTRARLGMVICVPKGNSNKTINGHWEDETRLPEYYDGVYNYLKTIGLKEI